MREASVKKLAEVTPYIISYPSVSLVKIAPAAQASSSAHTGKNYINFGICTVYYVYIFRIHVHLSIVKKPHQNPCSNFSVYHEQTAAAEGFVLYYVVIVTN